MATSQTSKKNHILEILHNHLHEEEWCEGLALYKQDRVKKIRAMNKLLTVEIEGQTERNDLEVRIKIHPTGRFIQWIECTCRKNRKYGIYCEHIAASMIHLDREESHYLAGLDEKNPIKVPNVSTKRSLWRSQDTSNKGPIQSDQTKGETKPKTIIEHLKSSIRSCTAKQNSPTLNVELEIRPGQVSLLTLDIDASADFVANEDNQPLLTGAAKNLRVIDNTVSFGTFVSLKGDSDIVVEKVLAIKSSPSFNKRHLDKLTKDYKCAKCTTLGSPLEEENRASQYLLFPYKKHADQIGERFCFIKKIGYARRSDGTPAPEWYELPFQKTYKKDHAAELVSNGYERYQHLSTVWIDESLAQQKVDLPEIKNIQVLKKERGWFYLDPTYGQGKSTISMSQMLTKVQKENSRFIRSNKDWYQIPEFITQNEWTLDESSSLLKVSMLEILKFSTSESVKNSKFQGDSALLQELKKDLDFNRVSTVPSLAKTNLKLRAYQEVGLKWLWWLYKNGLHGLLADDMGLGKTHQAMAIMAAIFYGNKGAGQFLIVCPTTVLDHWEDKIVTFIPQLKHLKFHGPKRNHLVAQLNKCNIILTSYGLLVREIKSLQSIEWDTVILDEAHYVKNHMTATYKAARRLKSRLRLCLTGTPIENHLSELKNIFDFLAPGYLGSDRYFREHYIASINQAQEERQKKEERLQKILAPLKLRRTKEQVLTDLPAKVEDIRHCSLSDEQVKLYRDIVNMRSKPLINQLKEESKPIPFLHVFTTLQLLKQVCDHPALIVAGSDYRKHHSEKFELLKSLIEESLASQNKVVIFSQYIGMINIIKQFCAEENIGHTFLTGQTQNRGRVIQQFQEDPNINVFIGSLMAGGIGIDLTAASVVIHYDRWWNASKENQATDRIHRIGQTKFVQVFKLVTKGTLEEKIDLMIQEKNKLMNRFLTKDEEIFKSMSRKDLIELLQ